MRYLLLAVVGVGLAACEPDAAVTMTRAGAGYQLQFENCSRPGQRLPVSRVDIRRASAADGDAPHCSLERIDGGEPLTGSWRYGDEVPGYRTRGCGPLRPGDAYRIQVALGPVAADAEVSLGADGAVRAARGGCP